VSPAFFSNAPTASPALKARAEAALAIPPFAVTNEVTRPERLTATLGTLCHAGSRPIGRLPARHSVRHFVTGNL